MITCDKCGVTLERSGEDTRRIATGSYADGTSETYELCQDCYDTYLKLHKEFLLRWLSYKD